MISLRLFKFRTVILFCFKLTGLFKKQRLLTLLSNYKNCPSKAKNINCKNIYDIKYENESRNSSQGQHCRTIYIDFIQVIF